MPKKVRELEADLRAGGFQELPRRGKGRHRLWIHRPSGVRATVSGKPSADATPEVEGHVRGPFVKRSPKPEISTEALAVKGSLMRHQEDEYMYRVWWSSPDASYMADVMELSGVLAFGETPEGALHNARDVARVWLDDAAAERQLLPEPRGHLAWVARELQTLTAEPVSADDVRAIRRNLGLTQRAFADVLGVSLNTVQAWEQGVNAPSGAGQHLLRLIDALNDANPKPLQLRGTGSTTF